CGLCLECERDRVRGFDAHPPEDPGTRGDQVAELFDDLAGVNRAALLLVAGLAGDVSDDDGEDRDDVGERVVALRPDPQAFITDCGERVQWVIGHRSSSSSLLGPFAMALSTSMTARQSPSARWPPPRRCQRYPPRHSSSSPYQSEYGPIASSYVAV